MKNSSDTMGNRTRNIPACSVVTGYEQPEIRLFATAVSRLSGQPPSLLAPAAKRREQDAFNVML